LFRGIAKALRKKRTDVDVETWVGTPRRSTFLPNGRVRLTHFSRTENPGRRPFGFLKRGPPNRCTACTLALPFVSLAYTRRTASRELSYRPVGGFECITHFADGGLGSRRGDWRIRAGFFEVSLAAARRSRAVDGLRFLIPVLTQAIQARDLASVDGRCFDRMDFPKSPSFKEDGVCSYPITVCLTESIRAWRPCGGFLKFASSEIAGLE